MLINRSDIDNFFSPKKFREIPVAAGWEASMQPLCYAAPFSLNSLSEWDDTEKYAEAGSYANKELVASLTELSVILP